MGDFTRPISRAQALASGPVIDAIRSGRHARIAVVYLEWGGADSQHVIADWTLIRDEEDARAFGTRLMAAPRAARGWNSISGAIDHGMRLMMDNAFEGERRVIDISADGAHFGGRPVRAARDDAVARGVTINGLVVQPPEGRLAVGGVPLRTHFEQDVIGGAGAFVVTAESRREFQGAVMAKLVREIADGGPGQRRTAAWTGRGAGTAD